MNKSFLEKDKVKYVGATVLIALLQALAGALAQEFPPLAAVFTPEFTHNIVYATFGLGGGAVTAHSIKDALATKASMLVNPPATLAQVAKAGEALGPSVPPASGS